LRQRPRRANREGGGGAEGRPRGEEAVDRATVALGPAAHPYRGGRIVASLGHESSALMPLTVQDYPAVIAARIAAERLTLASRWLERLRELLTVTANEVFPSEQLLDHIPALVDEISRYLAAPEEEAFAANASVMEKARELGMLRYKQRASAHQLLHEYEILGEILEAFLVEETGRLA